MVAFSPNMLPTKQTSMQQHVVNLFDLGITSFAPLAHKAGDHGVVMVVENKVLTNL